MLGRSVLVWATALSAAPLWAATAQSVVDYDFGVDSNAGYHDLSTPLGETSRITGAWGDTTSLSTPYGNPWSSADWVSIGKGGHLTLQLQNYALPQAAAPELNVLVFQQLNTDGSFTSFYDRQARVSVSEDGTNWVNLNNNNIISFDVPATGYIFNETTPIPYNVDWGSYGDINTADLGNYTPSDYGLPMPGTIGVDSLTDAYGNSGGGNWLDISSTGLSKVGFIRFDVDANAPAYFALDAVYLNNNAIGAPVPEPAISLVLGAFGLPMLLRRHRR
ncbi:MAG: hypothetical protein IT447_07820 [Phycisphaerales bacterium]|jgi:hypothetical protein|nr:hypothetical protein [Phycisphaerales bacterium]